MFQLQNNSSWPIVLADWQRQQQHKVTKIMKECREDTPNIKGDAPTSKFHNTTIVFNSIESAQRDQRAQGQEGTQRQLRAHRIGLDRTVQDRAGQ